MTGSEVLPCPLRAGDPRQSVRFLAENSHLRVPDANPQGDDSSSVPGTSSGHSSLALSSPSWWRPGTERTALPCVPTSRASSSRGHAAGGWPVG